MPNPALPAFPTRRSSDLRVGLSGALRRMHNSRHVLRFPTCRVLCTTVVHDTGHVPGAGTWPELCMLKNGSPYPAAVLPTSGGQTAHSERFPMTRSQFDPL